MTSIVITFTTCLYFFDLIFTLSNLFILFLGESNKEKLSLASFGVENDIEIWDEIDRERKENEVNKVVDSKSETKSYAFRKVVLFSR